MCLFTFNKQAGCTTVSCVLKLIVPDLLHLLSCYYSVKSCCVFVKKGSYFISTFCLYLNASDALSAIFTPLSILTKIYNLSLARNACWLQKNRNFLDWCKSPHQTSAVVFSPFPPCFSGLQCFHQPNRQPLECEMISSTMLSKYS